MEYVIQKAREEDLDRILGIYAIARDFMARNGNPTQWGNSYPAPELLQKDIALGKLYTLSNSSGIHGVFYFAIESDPTYSVIYDGAWRSDAVYGVIHRIAGDGSGGILKAAVDFAAAKIGYLRIDTHENNLVMQKALQKQGFRRSGTIFVEDGTPRIAYERIDGVREAEDADLDALLKLYCHLHESTIPEDSPQLRNTWKRMMEDGDHHVIVYEHRGNIVSSCICVIIPNLTRNVRPYGFVENVVTHEAYRGRGYASTCLAYAKELAKRNNCYKLMLLTGAKDEKTLTFYRNAGFNSADKTAFVQWFA